MERLQLRSSDYKNHRIFSLRCLHKDLIPVSIKLKSTVDTPGQGKLLERQRRTYYKPGLKPSTTFRFKSTGK